MKEREVYMEQVITILDASNALGVSKTTITRTVEALGLKLNKSGNRYVLTAEQFDMIRADLIQREVERQKIQSRPIPQPQPAPAAPAQEEPSEPRTETAEQGSEREEYASDSTMAGVIETFREQLTVKDEQLKNLDDQIRSKDEEINRLIDNIEKLYGLIEREKAEKESVTAQLLKIQEQNAFYQQLQITEKAEMRQSGSPVAPQPEPEQQPAEKKKKKGFFGLFGGK